MKRSVWTINLSKSKFVMLIIVILILVIPIIVPIFAKGKRSEDVDIGESYQLSPNSIEFSKVKIKDDKLKIFLAKENKVVEMSLEEYLPGVVASEMPANFELEALSSGSCSQNLCCPLKVYWRSWV